MDFDELLTCDDCGAEIIQDCLICGAPNCCQNCCMISEEEHKKHLEEIKQNHINHGGWMCHFCKYDGQDNTKQNRFCFNCKRHI